MPLIPTEAPILPGSFAEHRSAIGRLPIASKAIAAGCAAAVLAAGLTAIPRAAASVPSQKTWELKLATRWFPPLTSRSEFTNVVAEGRTGWFFGGSNFAGRGVPEIERRNNGHWHTETLPSGLHSSISAASAVSPDNIWAVTYLGGAVLNWHGSHWHVIPGGGWSSNAQVTGIVAFSSQNVWLFGANGRRHRGAGTWHLSGTRWVQVGGMAADIYQASAASPTDMWGFGGVQGSRNALLRFRGSTWAHVRPAALAGFTYSFVLALSPTSVWVAGSVAGTPKLGHYDGHGWTSLSMPALVPATGMCRDGRGGLWVIANSNFGPSFVLDRSASGHWTTVPVGRTSASQVLACALLPGRTSTWGAGKAPAPSGSAAAVYAYGNVP